MKNQPTVRSTAHYFVAPVADVVGILEAKRKLLFSARAGASAWWDASTWKAARLERLGDRPAGIGFYALSSNGKLSQAVVRRGGRFGWSELTLSRHARPGYAADLEARRRMRGLKVWRATIAHRPGEPLYWFRGFSGRGGQALSDFARTWVQVVVTSRPIDRHGLTPPVVTIGPIRFAPPSKARAASVGYGAIPADRRLASIGAYAAYPWDWQWDEDGYEIGADRSAQGYVDPSDEQEADETEQGELFAAPAPRVADNRRRR